MNPLIELPDKWINTSLGDISKDIAYGYTASASLDRVGPKFLRITDIVPDSIDWNSVPFCEINNNELRKYKLNQGDIVVARTGATTGFNKIIKNIDFDVVFASYLIRFVINRDEADPFYIGHILRSRNWYEYVEAISGGSAQPGANAKQLASFEIFLPPLPEQKAIAAVLSSLDDKIDLLHRQNKTLEAMAETLFRQWFVEEAGDWEVKPLREVVEVSIGRTPPRLQHQWFSNSSNDVKWISIKDLGSSGIYVFKTAECLTQDAVKEFNIPVISENTVILSFKMTVGRVAITTEKMLSNEAIAHFTFREGTPFTVEYLYLFLKNFQYELLGSTSSIVTAINSAMIRDMQMLLPDESTMKKFDQVAKSQFSKIRKNQVQIQILEKLRDSLLPKLMSGEVRVCI